MTVINIIQYVVMLSMHLKLSLMKFIRWCHTNKRFSCFHWWKKNSILPSRFPGYQSATVCFLSDYPVTPSSLRENKAFQCLNSSETCNIWLHFPNVCKFVLGLLILAMWVCENTSDCSITTKSKNSPWGENELFPSGSQALVATYWRFHLLLTLHQLNPNPESTPLLRRVRCLM